MAPFFEAGPETRLKAAFTGRSGRRADNRGMRWFRPPSTLPTPCGPGARPSRTRASGRLALPVVSIRLASLRLTSLLLALALSGVPVARADGRDDHEQARAAMLAGEVLPLPALLERLQRSHPGQVLELELERDDGRWVYEVRLLQPDGRLLRLDVDARTAEVLRARRKGDAPAR